MDDNKVTENPGEVESEAGPVKDAEAEKPIETSTETPKDISEIDDTESDKNNSNINSDTDVHSDIQNHLDHDKCKDDSVNCEINIEKESSNVEKDSTSELVAKNVHNVEDEENNLEKGDTFIIVTFIFKD